MSNFPLQAGFILGESTSLAAATESAALLFIKILLIIAGFLYVSFSVIVVRQISLMRKTLITPVSPLLQIIGFGHLLLAIFIFVFFLFL